MMKVLLWLAALPICSIGPGVWVVRRLRWSRAEKLVAAVGASLVALYVASFALFWVGVSARPAAWALLAVSGAAAWSARDELLRFVACRSTRRLLVSFALVLAVVLAFTASIRTFSGGGWYRDWYEHFERTHDFLDRPAHLQEILEGGSALPARPPLMNVVAAHFLALGDGSFAAFQIVAAWLNSLAFLGGALALGAWGRRGRRSLAVFSCLVLLNPSFLQNATYPWTKLASAFFVLLGTVLYLRGWRKNDASRIVASAIALAAASLVHYSAVPYGIFLVGHYLIVLARRAERRRRLEILGSLAAAGLLIASWIGWSDFEFGSRETLTSNTTWKGTAALTARQNAIKIARNLSNTLIPHPLREPARATAAFLGNSGSVGFVHDYVFLVYQHSALPSMGLVGGLVACGLWIAKASGARKPRRADAARARRTRASARFWSGWILLSAVLGIAAFPEFDLYGLAHIALQPIALVGLAFLASRLGCLRLWTRCLVLVGAAFDAALGIALHFWAQTQDVAAIALTSGASAAHDWGLRFSGSRAPGNTSIKLRHQLTYLGDLAPIPRDILHALLALVLLAVLLALARAILWPIPTVARSANGRPQPAAEGG